MNTPEEDVRQAEYLRAYRNWKRTGKTYSQFWTPKKMQEAETVGRILLLVIGLAAVAFVLLAWFILS